MSPLSVHLNRLLAPAIGSAMLAIVCVQPAAAQVRQPQQVASTAGRTVISDLRGETVVGTRATPAASRLTQRKPVVSTSIPTPLSGLGAAGPLIDSPAGFGVVPSLAMDAPGPSQVTQQYALAADSGLKIFVDREGWYRITKTAMLNAGFDPGNDPKALALFCGGAEQSIVVDDGGDRRFDSSDAVEFFGQRLDTAATGARTYWLRSGNGAGARVKSSTGKTGKTVAGSISFTYESRERDTFIADVTNNGDQQNVYGPVILSDPSYANLMVGNLDPSWSGSATLELVVQGLTDNPRTFTASINGTPLGQQSLTGFDLQTFTWSFDQSRLHGGANELTLQSLGDDYDASGVVSIRLTYGHLLRADEGALEAMLPGGSLATVGGFTAGSVRALDVTDAQHPVELAVAVASEVGGTFAASFTPASGGQRKVLVLQASRVLGAPEMAVNQPSSWNAVSGKGGADFVIITHAAFAPAAVPLAALRQSEGLATALIDVDDLYDEFNFGIRSPDAIRTFLRLASHWKKAPKYVLLVGDASSDERNSMGFGIGDYLPTKLVPTFYMKTASDDWFADLNGDGVPDLSIGRIPVRTPEEASLVLGRIVARGTPAGPWSTAALFVSDALSEYDFVSMTNQVAPLVPGSWTKQYVDAGSTPTPRAAIATAMNGGQLLVNYIGHGSVSIWGLNYSSPTFNGPDAMSLANGGQLPFLVSMECLNGSFHDAFQESMAESFLKAPDGGAIAVFASSTLTFPDQQMILDAELLRQLFNGPAPRLGDACRRAKLPVSDPDVRNSWMLFGDPTMKLGQ